MYWLLSKQQAFLDSPQGLLTEKCCALDIDSSEATDGLKIKINPVLWIAGKQEGEG